MTEPIKPSSDRPHDTTTSQSVTHTTTTATKLVEGISNIANNMNTLKSLGVASGATIIAFFAWMMLKSILESQEASRETGMQLHGQMRDLARELAAKNRDSVDKLSERFDRMLERHDNNLDRIVLRLETNNRLTNDADREAINTMRMEMMKFVSATNRVAEEIKQLHVTNLDMLQALSPSSKPSVEKKIKKLQPDNGK